MRNKLIAILIGIFVGQFVLADEVKTGSVEKLDLSFEQAYELMLTNNNGIKATLEEVKEKKYQKKAAIGHFFPKIGINSSLIHFNGPITVGMGALGAVTLQDENLWLTTAGATWNIFTGGKILALNAAARAKLEATNEKYRLVTNDLTAELVKRYYGLRLAEDVVTVRKQVYETTKKHLEDAKKLEKAGIIPKSERLHAEVAFAQAEREFEASVRDKNIVEEGLKTLIKADNVDLKGIEIIPSSLLFVYNSDFAKLDEFKRLALEKNPNLKQMDAKKKLAQANYRSEVANYSPTVTLFAYDVLASQNQSYQIPSWAVGGTVNWMLFDGLTRENNVKAADCVRKQVNYEKIDAQNNVESLVTKKYEELMKYKEQYDSTNKSIENADEALRTTTLAFNEGFGTSLSVTDAQTALSGVKIQRLNAIYNYDVTLTELLKTDGSAEEILNYIKNSTKEKL
ncbi:MAG: TolC family protein [Candidatus Gastranaerophilaceae bacterium]